MNIFLKDILSAIPLGFLLSFMIGPVFFVLLETSVVKGFRAALMFDLGVVLADIVFITIAFFSSYRLIQSIKDDPALFIFGGIVMLTYGIISFINNRKEAKKAKIDEIDPELLRTFERLGIPLQEQKRISGVAMDVVFDSVSIGQTHTEELEKAKQGIDATEVPDSRKLSNSLPTMGPVDVVFLDLEMPGFGGIEVARAFRAWTKFTLLRIVSLCV